MTAPAAELVVARFQESLNWLRRVPRSLRVTVYDKGGASPCSGDTQPEQLDRVPGSAGACLAEASERRQVSPAPSGVPPDRMKVANGAIGGTPMAAGGTPALPRRNCLAPAQRHRRAPTLVPLPNLGREAHTYLHHLVERYDTLADVTLFSQGHPFDHVPDLHRRLRELADGHLEVPGFLWLGFLIDADDAEGSLLFRNWSKNPERRPLPMESFYRHLWREAAPGQLVFYGGAHFAVTAECVRRQPRSFYARARDLSLALVDAAHCFERCWARVFGVHGIPEPHRNGPFPVYLKPIRRLLVDGSHAPILTSQKIAVPGMRRAYPDATGEPPPCSRPSR